MTSTKKVSQPTEETASKSGPWTRPIHPSPHKPPAYLDKKTAVRVMKQLRKERLAREAEEAPKNRTKR
jgi:hypothetical protein